MIRFAKLLPNLLSVDSRSQRECRLVHSLGVEVHIIDRSLSEEERAKIPSEYIHTPLSGVFKGGPFRRLPVFLRWAWYVRKGGFDVISCRDVSALLMGWMSNCFKPRSKRALLVYDAHEYEPGRNTTRARWVSRLVVRVEAYLMRRAYVSIMVNDWIADQIQALYKLPTRPLVIRNIPPYKELDPALCRDRRAYFMSLFPKEYRSCRVLMYHGVLMRGRGNEEIISLLPELPDCVLIMLGNGEEDYVNSLRKIAEEAKVSDRFAHHPAVPYAELIHYVGAADLSFINAENICESYYFGLSNKLFEAIQAEVPLVISNFPEMCRIVLGYGVGVAFEKGVEGRLKEAIRGLLDSPAAHAKCVENARIAKKELCWEVESRALVDLYRQVFKAAEERRRR